MAEPNEQQAEKDQSRQLREEYAAWAEAGGAAGEPEYVGELLVLLDDQLGVSDPREMAPSDLRTLLLSVYPRKITADPDAAPRALAAARGLVGFAAQSISPARADALAAMLDEIAPEFEAEMDPGRLGGARSLLQAMAGDGVDAGDPAALQAWMAGYKTGLQHFHAGADDDDDDDLDDEFDDDFGPDFDLDLAEPSPEQIRDAFGLPEQLPAVRLPDEAGLARLARSSPLLRRAAELARWADGKMLTVTGGLRRKALAEAAALAGVAELPDGAVRIDDVPALVPLWQLAWCIGLEAPGGRRMEADDDMAAWPGGADDDVLAIWSDAHDHILGHVLDSQDAAGDFDDLPLGLAGLGLALGLLAAGRGGITVAECRHLVHDMVTAELEGPEARRRWRRWLQAHGDPADTLTGLLAELGAVTIDRDEVALTPLGLAEIRDSMEGVVEIPLLPPAAKLTAAQLVTWGKTAGSAELEPEQQAWIAARPAGEAARELLAVAAGAGSTERLIAISIITEIGAAAAPAWREALDDPLMHPYAVVALAEIADPAVGVTDAAPGLTGEDSASLLADTIVGMAEAADSGELPAAMAEAVEELPLQALTVLFDLMRRSVNPAAARALELLGRHHPDSQVAKAARKAQFQSASAPRPPGSRPAGQRPSKTRPASRKRRR